MQIVEALGHSDLSAQELSDMLDVDSHIIRYHLHVLQRAGTIMEERHGHHITYAVTQPTLVETCHVLYELWADEVEHAYTHARITL